MIYQAYTWKHSFHDFEKVLKIIEESKTIQNPDQFHHFGVIHFFEISFELAWKIMKDYLEAEGFLEIKSPRDAIKQAFNIELIVQGHLWLEALENRNLSVHTYNEALANELVNNIKNNYLPLLLELKNKLSQKI
ncbi:MAG: HI0074 family nucleotidyltransferase substrate-binding subunit [Bacteroidales bacterium]|jgi:nucleotidyltransferase substrate binding protein (TIGR01987 family)|nr:HI0074 family nucleotidyltransferase substrate-binding subunit [Bacteroidales bacterium]